MHFDERNVGDYRIFAGALEAPKGDGYIAAMIVQRIQGVPLNLAHPGGTRRAQPLQKLMLLWRENKSGELRLSSHAPNLACPFIFCNCFIETIY